MEDMLANVQIFDDKILVSQKEGSFFVTRTISPDGLSQAFSCNIKFDTGFLPCREGVVRYIKEDSRIVLFYQTPTKQRDLIFRDGSLRKTFKNVACPWTLFTVVMQVNAEGKYSIVDEFCHALKGPLLLSLDTLYRFPYTNVFSDGRICWGDNRESNLQWKNLAGLITHLELFYEAPFNSHLEDSNFHSLKIQRDGTPITISTTASLFAALEGEKEFPEHILKNVASFKGFFDRTLNISL